MKGISDCEKFNYKTDEILSDYNHFYQSRNDLEKLIKNFKLELK